MKKLLSSLTALALVVLMVPSATAAGAVLTLTPATLTTTGITTANDVNVAYTTAGAFSNGDTIKVTIKNAAGALLSAADVVGGNPATLVDASTGPDTQAVNAADGSFAYGAGTATYTFGAGAAAGTAVSLDFALPNLEGGVYTINVAENRAFSSQPETYGSTQLNVNASVVGATLAFVQSTPATITDSANNFVNNGFKAGMAVTVAGATTGGNNGTYIIQAVAAGTLTLQAGATLAAAEAGAVGTVVSASTQANQVRVSAVVEPILAVALSANAIDLGVLTPTSTGSATNTVTVKTNANSGYNIYVGSDNGTNAGLRDAVIGKTIPSVADTAQVQGTSGFSVHVSGVAQGANGAGTLAADAAFDGILAGEAAVTQAGNQVMAAGNGTTDGDVATVTYQANVSAVQEAGNYSTTVTYIVTGSF